MIIETRMRPKEIVISNKKRSKSNSAVSNIKAVKSPYMEFISAVKAFDELFERSEFL